MEISVTDRAGGMTVLEARAGDTLMQLLREQVDLTIGTCGGAISCGTCVVRLTPAWLAALPEASLDEAEMLEALDAASDCRLSCQLVVDAAAGGQAATLVAE